MKHIRLRLISFVILSAVGIVYIAANYLGVVDKVLGRGITVSAQLPASGGLFEGSEVTYRGVKVGKVTAMEPTAQGVEVHMDLKEGTRIPKDSPIQVNNLTAVGEQYLDFQPTSTAAPYAEEGEVFHGTEASLPVGEDVLLTELDAFVNSVDKGSLRTVVDELGKTFHDTAEPLQKLIDNGTLFIDEAAKHKDATVSLLDNGLTVLRTQERQGGNLRSLARDLRQLTKSLRDSDADLRVILQAGPAAIEEVDALLTELEPTLPTLLANLVTVNQVILTHLPGVEQLLVTYPRIVSSGFTGTPPDGWGRVSLQFANTPEPCTQGYLPRSQWRSPYDVSDSEAFPARCSAGPPYNMRGSKYAPQPSGAAAKETASGSYDPATGTVTGVVDQQGRPVRVAEQGDLKVLGEDAWKWLIIGPAATQ